MRKRFFRSLNKLGYDFRRSGQLSPEIFTERDIVEIKFKANTTGFDNTSLVVNGSRYTTSSGTTERTVNITFNANATMTTERWNNATTGK